MNTLNLSSPALVTPLAEGERVRVIDSLRGIALLGILLMNIPGFGLPGPAIFDPTVYSEGGTINYQVWYIVELFPEGTQRALFSMLFGAGMLVFTTRLEKKIPGMLPAELYFRRQLWLLLFGLVNAFVFMWFWDILYAYAICGFFIFAFRRMNSSRLLVLAAVCLALQLARDNRDLYQQKQVIERGEAAAAVDTMKTKLTEKQKDDLAAIVAIKEKQTPENKLKAAEKIKTTMQGSHADIYGYVSNRSYVVETTFFYNTIFDILMFMFLGMAFYKAGILQGTHPLKIYVWMMVAGLGMGIPFSWYRLEEIQQFQFNEYEITKNTSFVLYEVSRSLRAIGIFGLIMTAYKSGWFNGLFRVLQPVGQVAFTNYLSQSVICGLFFYGTGFGFYGELQRHELYYVVGVVWVFQVVFSNVWVRYYHFGPMEWLWRSLTYWEIQPFRKTNTGTVATSPAMAGIQSSPDTHH